MQSLTLTGKKALITGGASGIGAAVVDLFVRLGAEVCTVDLQSNGATPAQVHSLRADVCSEEDGRSVTRQAIEAMGTVDVLVNCAGIPDTYTPTLEQNLASWQRIVDVDLTGTYLMCKAVGAHMVERRAGAIVNISSIVGLGGFPRRNAYGAAKAGVIMLTRSLASEWGAMGIRVNCIAPGYIRTPLVDALVDARKVNIDRVERRTPMARMGHPGEIAQAAAYLSSDWSSFVTGVTLPVDGGWSAFGGAGDVETA
ncbi:SDR family oxidoreductase [Polaromonas sp. P1-6]|nr:SDR family oxidoreductase [Polaromonas sp. P1-6]